MRLHMTEMGQGPPVALLHGLFGAAANLGGVARQLAADYRVLSIDLRNHGASPHAPDMSYAAMAADVIETLAAADALPAVLVGHSMGGKVAMHAALDAPDAVSRLVVSDIAPARYPPGFRAYADAMLDLPLAGITRPRADAALAAAVPDAGVRAFLLQNLRFGDAPAWRIGLTAIAAALPEIEDWPVVSARYPGPSLFVSGDRSDYVRAEHRAVIRELFPASRFVRIKDAGHWIHADNMTGFAAALRGFFSPDARASTS